MAIIYSYPQIGELADADNLIISDASNENKTKSVTIEQLSNYFGISGGGVDNYVNGGSYSSGILTLTRTGSLPDINISGFSTGVIGTLQQVLQVGNTTGNNKIFAQGGALGGMNFADNTQLSFGANDDLSIRHNSVSTGSEITETGAGGLTVTGSTTITFKAGLLSDTYAVFNDNGAVSLRYDNNIKFETTTDGIKVTDTGTHAKIAIDNTATGDSQINFELSGTSKFAVGVDNSDSDKFKISGSSTLGNNDMLVIDSSGNVGVGVTVPSEKLDVAGNIELPQFGYVYFGKNTSDQLTIFNSISGSEIRQAGSGYLDLKSITNGIRLQVGSGLPDNKVVVSSTGQVQFNDYTSSTSFTGTSVATLGVDSSGNIITTSPGGGGGDTYDLNAGTKSGNSVPLNLTSGSGSDNSLVTLTEGTGGTLTRNSATQITIASSGGGGGTVTGTGTANTLSKWTSSTAQGNSNITDDNNEINIFADHTFENNGDFAIGDTLGINGGIGLYCDSSNIQVKSSANIVYFQGGFNSYFSRNLGIGATTTPSEKLHVTGNARVTGAYYDSTNSPGGSGQVLSSTITGTEWITSSSGGGLNLLSMTISASDILALNGVSGGQVQLLSAPGANKMYQVVSVSTYLDYVSSPYNVNQTLKISNSPNGAAFANITTSFINSISSVVATPVIEGTASIANSQEFNKPLGLGVTNGVSVSVTQGNSPIKISIVYRIVDFN